MGIKPSEISALIKEQIKNYAHEMEQNDVGKIVSVGDGVCLIYGLDKAMYGELLEFPNNVYGLDMNLEEEHVGAVLLGDSKEVKEGDVVKRTNKIMEVPVGDALIGRVVSIRDYGHVKYVTCNCNGAEVVAAYDGQLGEEVALEINVDMVTIKDKTIDIIIV